MKKKDPIAALLQNPMSYLYQKKEKNIVAISSRIRLARNIAQFPFPVTLNLFRLLPFALFVALGKKNISTLLSRYTT